MKKILKNADAYFAGFMFAITLVVVVVNVFTRKFANYIIPWGEEVATTCFVYTTFGRRLVSADASARRRGPARG